MKLKTPCQLNSFEGRLIDNTIEGYLFIIQDNAMEELISLPISAVTFPMTSHRPITLTNGDPLYWHIPAAAGLSFAIKNMITPTTVLQKFASDLWVGASAESNICFNKYLVPVFCVVSVKHVSLSHVIDISDTVLSAYENSPNLTTQNDNRFIWRSIVESHGV